MSEFSIIRVTFPDFDTADKCVDLLLKEKLIACAQFSDIESVYIWKGAVEREKEILAVMKSRSSLFSALEAVVKQCHPFEAPQIIATPIDKVSAAYGDWLHENLRENC